MAAIIPGDTPALLSAGPTTAAAGWQLAAVGAGNTAAKSLRLRTTSGSRQLCSACHRPDRAPALVSCAPKLAAMLNASNASPATGTGKHSANVDNCAGCTCLAAGFLDIMASVGAPMASQKCVSSATCAGWCSKWSTSRPAYACRRGASDAACACAPRVRTACSKDHSVGSCWH